MKSTSRALLLMISLIGSMMLLFGYTTPPPLESTPETTEETLQTGLEAFDKMMSVLTHKRCANYHPSGDRPQQGENSHIHNFGVERGLDNHGVAALHSESYYQAENNNFAGFPGAPEWSLAPLSMAWEGLTRVEIARSILNPDNNGGRTLEKTAHHLTEHELGLSAWNPGVNSEGIPREKPLVSKEDYIKAVRAQAEAGAPIPEK